jgi:hypothetical protein
LQKKIFGRESQGAWRQDELIGGKPPVFKVTLTLTLEEYSNIRPSYQTHPNVSPQYGQNLEWKYYKNLEW